MMGGSASKAAELARSAPRPEQVKVLEGRVAAVARRYDQAVQSFMAVPAGLEYAVATDALAWSVQCALGMVNASQAANALPLLERLRRDYPTESGPAYALARVRGEAGAHEDAARIYEQAATLKGADFWPIAYRLGMEQQALGRNELAKASFTRFIAAGKGQQASLDDAKKRLGQLGS
jgi:tetratricopeptide (TPR) repeat protein